MVDRVVRTIELNLVNAESGVSSLADDVAICRVGSKSNSHFSRRLRERYGKTPSEYTETPTRPSAYSAPDDGG